MSKVIFEHLNNKELKCPLCEGTDRFSHSRIQIIREETSVNEPFYANEEYEKPKISEDTLDTFECSCGYVLMYDTTGKSIKDDVWDEEHEGDIIVTSNSSF